MTVRWAASSSAAAGPLKRARELEGFQFLHLTLQQTLGTGWSSAIKIVS